MTTQEDIRGWFKIGLNKKATHMVVRCDTFSYEDYPEFAYSEEEARKIAGDFSNMQKTMEVYNLAKDMEEQIGRHRCFEY